MGIHNNEHHNYLAPSNHGRLQNLAFDRIPQLFRIRIRPDLGDSQVRR